MPGDDDFRFSREAAARVSELQALTLRVAQLELLVAELQDSRGVGVASAASLATSNAAPETAREAAAMPSAQAIPAPPPLVAEAAFERSTGPAFEARSRSLEDRLGSQIFNLIGVIAIIVGTSWALKLAIEHGLIGPTARVVLGLVVGAAAIVWSERFRRKGHAAFSYTLKAVGSGVLYLVLWAAMQIYHLLPAPAALTAMVLVTAWNAWMAWAQDAELLAAYALAGGLATPLLLSTGGDHETFLFTYVAVIDAAAVLLVRVKPWQRMLMPAFLATVAYFIGWYSRFFHVYRPIGFDGQSWETALFACIFFVIVGLVSLRGWQWSATAIEGGYADTLVLLGNCAFLPLALYSVFQDSGLHDWLAWLMVGLAAVYLALARVQRRGAATAIHLGAAIILLTVAIPLKASGHTLTVAWLVEGLVLLWVATRLGASTEPARRILTTLTVASFVLGLGSLVAHWWWFGSADASFLNANLASALVAVLCLGGVVWLATRSTDVESEPAAVATSGLFAIELVALLLAFGVAAPRFASAFLNARFFSASLALAILAGACWTAYWLNPRWQRSGRFFRSFAGVTLAVFNVVAILTFEREIDMLFLHSAGVDAGLERSLAISGFLMLYGAILLAVGFWRRNAPVRWQALVLLIFTIVKVFLYDISGLSQGYRVVSFLALGALLLAVSFAYQKDWLGLKQGAAPRASQERA